MNVKPERSGPLLLISVALLLPACTKPAYVNEADRASAPDASPPSPPENTPLPTAVEDPPPDPREAILALREGAIGRIYHNVSIADRHFDWLKATAIDDSGVRTEIPLGLASFSWDEVSDDWRAHWGYDPNSSMPGKQVAAATPDSGNPGESEAQVPAVPVVDAAKVEILAKKGRAEREIAELTERISLAESEIEEAKTFLDELALAYAAEDKEAAKMQADRIYARMRRSSGCSSCAPPPKAKIGGISTSQADRDKVFESLERRIDFVEGYLEKDRARLELLVTWVENLEV